MTSWFVEAMPDAEYHGMSDRLSSTGIKALLRSPAHFRHERDHGREPTDAFDKGSVAHTLALGTGWAIAVWDGDSWAGKEAQEFKRQARDDNKIPIKREEYRQAEQMWDRLRRHPAGRYFEPGTGISEISLFWTDKETLIPCRARLDRLTLTDDGRPLIVDYKTCQDASPHGVQSSIAKFRYYVQQPFYQIAMQEAGLDPDACSDFIFVFQETKPPHSVTVARLASSAVGVGHREVERAMEIYAHCDATGEWPDYTDTEIEVDLPRWKYYEQEAYQEWL
jgi:hypothetical protein